MTTTTRTMRRLSAAEGRPMTEDDLLPGWRSWDRAYELHVSPRRHRGDARAWPLKGRWAAYLALVNTGRRLRGIR